MENTIEDAENNKEILKQHTVSQFLHQVLCLPQELAEEEAKKFMKHLHPKTIEHIIAFLDYITMCPMSKQSLITNFQLTLQQYEKENGNCMCPFQTTQCKNLTELKIGEKAKILKLRASGAIRRRLIDMGVLPDVEVELQCIAPLGDPIKIKMKGYCLTLRKAEAESILLQVDQEQSS